MTARFEACIELCERELHLLLYSSEMKKGQLHNLNQVKFDSYPISEGWLDKGQVQSQILIKTLNEVRQAHKIPVNMPVRVAIPLVNGFIREYHIPWIAPKYREAAVEYLAKEEMVIPQEDQVIGYEVIEDNKKLNTMSITLGATRRSLLERIHQAFRSTGFKPTTIEFSVAAFGEALDLQPRERYLYISEARGGLQIVLYHGIIPQITRFFPIISGSDLREWIAETARIFGLMNTDAPLRYVFISGQGSAKVFAQSLVSSELPGLNALTEINTIEQIAKMWPWRESLPQSILPCLPCLGLVFGNNPRKKNQNVNLLSEYQRTNKERFHQRIVAGILLGFLLSGFGLWLQGEREEAFLRTEIDELKSRADIQQVKVQSGAQATNAWMKVKEGGSGISNLLISLQDLAGEGISFEQLEYKEELLTLRGTANRAAQLEQFLVELKTQGWEQVQFHEYHQEVPNQINFTVTAVR